MYYFTVYTPWLARALQKKGFELLEVQPNFKNPRNAVYKFENSYELQKTVMELLDEKKRNN